MNHGQLLAFLNYIRRKDNIGDTISGQEYNRVCPMVANKFFKKIMGLPEQYQKGARDPIFGFGLNDISEEKIRPLKVGPVTLNISGGVADYPTDYFRKSACYRTQSLVQIPFVNDAKFAERRETVLDPPSVTDPVANLQATVIRFLPTSITTAQLEYIKRPTEPVMGYVVDADTAELIYVEHGAFLQINNPGNAGDVVALQKDHGIEIGTYTVLAGDIAEDVMRGLVASVNSGILSHNIKAVFDGEKIVFIDLIGNNEFLVRTLTGSITATTSDFTDWSIQFDWYRDIEAMNDIAELMIDMMGISNRDVSLIQWAEKEKNS